MPATHVRWAYYSAVLGAAVWAGLYVTPPIKGLGAIERLFLLAPLVATPLSLALLHRLPPGSTRAEGLAMYLQPAGAASAVATFLLPVGWPAAVVAVGWLVCLGGPIGLGGALRLRAGAARHIDQACPAIGMLYLSFGAGSLIVSRLGLTPFGIQEPIVLLTAVHYHFAAYVAPVIAGAAGVHVRPWPSAWSLYRPSVVALLVSPPLIALGFVMYEPILRAAATALLTLALVALAALFVRIMRHTGPAAARLLLLLAGASVVAGMILALMYASGDVIACSPLSIPRMARTHGVLNGVGFSVAGLLGWLLWRPAEGGQSG